MKRAVRVCVLALPLAMLAASPAFADVKTRDRSHVKFEGMLGRIMGMFGGKAAKEGVESTTAVKGDRKATTIASHSHIVDLTEEKIYDVDLKKKNYTVTTFDELRQKMREAQERAQKNADKGEQGGKPQKEVEIDFDVKRTGQKKQVAGYDTSEEIVTITVREKGKTLEEGGGLVMTIDGWVGPVIPHMKESSDFEMRYWRQLQGPQSTAMTAEQMAAVFAMYPLLKNAMDRWQKEGDKIQGTTLASTMTIEAVKSPEQMTQEQEDSGGGGLTGRFAKKLMKRGEPKQRATILTIDHEVLEVSDTVAADDLAIPADFKEKK